MAMRPVRGGDATPSRPLAGVQPVYEDFRPTSEWQQDEESDILLLFLPGFMRQHLKLSTEGKNTVRVQGERLVAGNKWSRLQEDYQVPEKCNTRAIRARFEGGILTIRMPWKKDNQAQQVGSKEAAKATPPMKVPPKSISSQDTDLKQQMSPPKAPIEPRPQKGADEIDPKVLDPPSGPQKGADEIQPKVLDPPSRPQKVADEIQPKVLDPPSRPQKVADEIHPKVLDPPSGTQKVADEIHPKVLDPPSGPQKGADEIHPKVLDLPSGPQKVADEIHPKVLDPPSGTQKVADEIHPKVLDPPSGPQKGADEIQPKVLDPPSRPQKVADEIHPKVLDPPSGTQKGADEIHPKVLDPPSGTQKGQDEQRDRNRSPKLMTSVNDGVEIKRIISNETKDKPAKSENVENLKEVTDDKRSIEKSKEAVTSLAENLRRRIVNEKEKSKKIEEKGEYMGQKEKQTTTTIASTSNDYGLGNYKKSVKSLAELNEERQLLVNIGVAVLVIVALGTYISYTTGPGKA